MRKNYNDAITVPVEVSSTQDGLFTVSEIKFEAGQEATTFSVDFPELRSVRPTIAPSW